MAAAQATSITLTLTHNGDFFSPAPAMGELPLGNHAGIDLNLAYRTERAGKVYYYLNRILFGAISSRDYVSHIELDNLLNDGFDTINTQPNGHDGSDDERSVIIGDYALVLPTGIEIQDFLAAGGDNPVPNGWADVAAYWAAGLAMDDDGNAIINQHERVVFAINSPFYGQIMQVVDGTNRTYAFFQVLTAQRTISVILPADPLPLRATTVEVATIDTTDSITDGSLTAKLIAVTSPIELGSTVSEVVILNNNLEVTVTGLNGEPSVFVNENSSATLVINVTPMTDQPRDVNLSYMDVISGTTEMTTIRVPAGSTSYEFPFPVGDDDIAAQPTREFRVSLEQGDGYGRGDPSDVKINVLDDDVATVSISAASNTVTEGDTIVFTITRDLAADQATSITLTLTHNGDFFSPLTDQLILGEHTGVNLNLTNPHRRNGKVYYYLNHNTGLGNDRITHDLLDDLLNDGFDTINTQPGGHDGSDDERSVIIGDYALVLPTGIEIQKFIAAGNNELPNGWVDQAAYWAAGLAMDDAGNARAGVHERVLFFFFDTSHPDHGQIITQSPDTDVDFVFFQVLTAQRTTVVDFPASQTPMDTVMVEVPTIDTADAIADGSLIAELIIEQDDSPIELGSTVTSEVAILHNNFVVTVTGIDGGSSVTATENSSVTLVINVEPPLPTNRALNVNLSYVDVISGTTEMRTITVPAGSMSQSFQVFVGDDDIAAQTTRISRVSLAPGGYVMGDLSSVGINVLNNDPAEVSISAVRDRVDEGAFAQFEVQVDKEIAVSLIVTINLITTREGSEISRSSTDVVITAGNTPALLTINTMEDNVEVDSFLTATIVSLVPQIQVSGAPTTPSTDNSSATVTILDNDVALSITAEPASVDLVVGNSADIRVSVSRIEGSEVTIEIDATAGLRVPSSLTLVTRDEVGVATITATDSVTTAMVRFRAIGYAQAMVQVNITTPPPPVELSVTLSPVEIVSGMSGSLTITATPTATITIISDNDNIASVAESAAAFELEGGADNSTTINVFGDKSGTTTLTIKAEAFDRTDTTASVEVNVLERLSIVAEPVSVDLVQGASTQISVRVNRLGAGAPSVSVAIAVTDGLSVDPVPLTLANTDALGVTVTATDTHVGIATLTFTAEGYTTATVAVEITPAPVIALSVTPTTVLNLVRFTSTEIEVSVGVDAILDVEATGAVRLEGGSMTVRLNLSGMTSARIEIVGMSEGMGTVTVTASGTGTGTGAVQEMLTVSVTVSTPTLVITGVPANINLVTRETTEFTVSVMRADAGRPGNVALTVVIDDENVAEVILGTINVEAGTTTATVTVTGFNVAGDTTLTLTAKHSDYETEIIKVPVNVSLRPIELSVLPAALEIVSGMSADLTITATPTAMITIISDNDNIASVAESAAAFELEGGANNSTRISVSGGNVDRTRLMIEASMTGYTTETATVEVDVLESLRIAATPVSVVLVAGGDSTQINVSVSRVVGASITVDIDASAGLSVEPSSVTLANLDAIEVAVTADAGASGTGTLMFTADNYAMAMVTIEIRPAPAIELSVLPAALEIVSGMSADLTITATPTAMITIISDDDNIASVAESAAAFELEGGANNSTRISVSGGNVDRTRLTIEASMTGYTTETATVEVDVLESLRIAATPVSVVLVAGGDSTQINVSVSRVVGESVRVDIDASAGLSVAPISDVRRI